MTPIRVAGVAKGLEIERSVFRPRGPRPSSWVPVPGRTPCPNGSGVRPPNRSSGQQHASRDRPAAVGDDGDLVLLDLTLSGLSPQLQTRLMKDPVPVQAPSGELTAIGVEWQLTVSRDAGGSFDKVSRLSVSAEAESLQPGQGEERKAVIELGNVDVPERK